MRCLGKSDLHTDSGFRRLTGTSEDDIKGYGMRGLNYFRKGLRRDNGRPCVHLVDSQCKSHRLVVRSSYGAEALAATHGVDDAIPTLVTLHEL